jgi:hypothetical protein
MIQANLAMHTAPAMRQYTPNGVSVRCSKYWVRKRIDP